jgi:hypothetical protein
VIPISQLESELISCEEIDLPDNIVGAAFMRNKDGSQHAAIFIRYKGDSNIFHLTEGGVIMEPVSPYDQFYHKSLMFLDPVLLPSFLTQCELILENANPRLGYYYDGALYDSHGNFVSPNGSPEILSCVGFCLSVIKGFLSDQDFFKYEDWGENSLDGNIHRVERLIETVKASNTEMELTTFRSNIRRIQPIEYISGGFSKSIPVEKAFIDGIVKDVEEILAAKVA